MTAATVDSPVAAGSSAEAVTVRRPRLTRSGVGNVAAVIIIVLWCLLPFYWMLVMSLRDNSYTFSTDLLPSHITFDNYRVAFNTTYNHFGRSLINGLIIGVTVTVISMVVAMFAAYALARLQFRGKTLILGVVLTASMFPQVALVTPIFQLWNKWSLLGTYQGLIIPQISFSLPLAVFILTSFFAEMPWELEQAAKVDGATPGQAFRLVILPLAAPALFTTAILVFLGSWNEYLLSSTLFASNNNVAPPTVAIANFTAGPHVVPYTQTMAAGIVITIPLILVVLLLQRRIVAGLSAGGVKG